MQKRRVGTISMAVVLISFGVLIFISQINKVSALEMAIKFWPGILLLVGGEILWAVYRNKDEDIRVRYDILSIFVVLLIVVTNLAIYGLMEVGLIDRLNTMISSHTYNYQMPLTSREIGDNIKKIVINPPDHSSLTLRTGKGKEIVSTARLNIAADSEEKAKELSADECIRVDEVGDIAYVSFVGRNDYDNGIYSISPHRFSLTIPEDRKVEITRVNSLELSLEGIGGDWVIDGVEQVKIRLERGIDARINAFVKDRESLKGNAGWDIKDKGEESYNIRGQLTYGEGQNIIDILNSYQIVVDELR